MHVEHLTISFRSIYGDSNYDESISSDEVAYATFFLFRLGPGMGLDLELESGGKLEEKERQNAEDALHYGSHLYCGS